jgi:hypothetical protein
MVFSRAQRPTLADSLQNDSRLWPLFTFAYMTSWRTRGLATYRSAWLSP